MNEVKNSQPEKSTPSQTVNSPVSTAKKKTNQMSEILGIEAVIIIVLILSALMILNYFNIVPISKNMPGIFGWLPHKLTPGQIEIANNQQQNGDANITPNGVPNTTPVAQQEVILIACPVSPGFCPQAKSVYNTATRRVEGLGFVNLGKELAVYALFKGTIASSTQKVDGANITTIVLTGDDGLVATYKFHGLPQREKGATGTQVKQSELIGILDGESSKLFDFTAQEYSFSLVIVNPENNQNITVRPREDGQSLDLE